MIGVVTVVAALGDVGVVLQAMLLLVMLLSLLLVLMVLIVIVNVRLITTNITINQLRYTVTNDTTTVRKALANLEGLAR